MLALEDPGGELLTNHISTLSNLNAKLRIAIALAETVGTLHRHGLLHRDINPGNILVTPQGDVRLTGFRYAIHQTQSRTITDLVSGTLPYIAPEQTGRMNRPVDCRSDLYALGITLYELFAGTLPFSASAPEEWIHSHIARVPPPL